MRKELDMIAVIGLGLGAIFGLAGTLVSDPRLQSTLWAIDSVGLVVASSLLTLRFARRRNEFVAAGFFVFAIGESVILSGTAAGLEGSVPSFAAGTALWSAALLLVSVPNEFPVWVRMLGVASSILFLITSARIFWGGAIVANSLAAPVLRIPISRPYFHRMDMELVERRSVIVSRETTLQIAGPGYFDKTISCVANFPAYCSPRTN